MKTIQTIIFFLFFYAIAQAQSLEISGGAKQIYVEEGNITFFYVDESPAPDLITTEVPLKGNKYAVSLALDYENFKRFNRPFFLLRFQGYLGEISGLDLGAGVAFPLNLTPSGKLRIHPEIIAVFGYNQKKLGILEVEAAGSIYIQVNGTQFEDYASVKAALQNSYLALKPGVKIAIGLNDKTEVRLYGGYHFGKGKSSVSFSGMTSSGETESELEKIGVSNMYFDVNGEQRADAPFWAKGLEVRAGLGFRF